MASPPYFSPQVVWSSLQPRELEFTLPLTRQNERLESFTINTIIGLKNKDVFQNSLQSKPKSCCHPQTKRKERVRDNLKDSASRLSLLLQVRDQEHKSYHKSTVHPEDSSNLWAVLPRFLFYSYSTFLLPIYGKNKLGLLSGSITMSPPPTTCLYQTD